MKTSLKLAALAVLLSTINHHLSTAHAQGTAFTYQGQLNSGPNTATGTYNLMFSLFSTNTGGSAIAGPVTENAVAVNNGLFTTTVDFGPGVFTGATNWLQIAVATNGSVSFTNLMPRQQLTPTPYAVYAESANATNLVGSVQTANLSGVALLNGGNPFTGGNQTVMGGSVGIGTTTPADALHLVGPSGIRTIVQSTGASYAGFLSENSQANWFMGNDPAEGYGTWEVYEDSPFTGPRLLINTNGNVGIGISAPGASFDDRITSASGAGTLISQFGSQANPRIELFDENISATIGPKIWFNAGNAAEIAGSGNIALMPTNNLGIGTLTPANKLDVQGSADFTGNVGIGTTSPDRPLAITGTGINGEWISLKDTTSTTRWHMNNEAGGLDFVQSGVADARLYLSTNNNVGIDNSTPETMMQVGNYGLGTNDYLTISTAGGNLYRAGIKLRHFNSGYGWTLESDEIDSSFRLYSHFNDSNGIVRMFVDRFSGNVGLNKTNPATALDVNGEVTCTAINVTSDRNAKEDFTMLDPRDVLAKVAALPITEWQYKAEKDKDAAAARHIGPMAQDFTAAFALGHDEKHISVVDEGGVALAAIQGLNQKLDEKDVRIQAQAAEIQELNQTVSQLQKMVEQMSQKMSQPKAE